MLSEKGKNSLIKELEIILTGDGTSEVKVERIRALKSDILFIIARYTVKYILDIQRKELGI
jgi:septum formation topological specificity factor MinE